MGLVQLRGFRIVLAMVGFLAFAGMGAAVGFYLAFVRDLPDLKSVADYRPEPVTVELADGSRVTARCYNLPADLSGEPNRAYAQSLLELAAALEFPDSYLEEIRQRC